MDAEEGMKTNGTVNVVTPKKCAIRINMTIKSEPEALCSRLRVARTHDMSCAPIPLAKKSRGDQWCVY